METEFSQLASDVAYQGRYLGSCLGSNNQVHCILRSGRFSLIQNYNTYHRHTAIYALCVKPYVFLIQS